MFNQPDFYTISQLDVKNKLLLPSTELYRHISFKVNALYQDIHNSLIDVHGMVANASKQIYAHPVDTLSAWYEWVVIAGTSSYTQIQTLALPVYQDLKSGIILNTQKTGHYVQALWDNPEQVTLATLEPVTHSMITVINQAEHYWEMFLINPEQFIATAFAPATDYLRSLNETTEAILISTYYRLTEFFSFLMTQPSATLKALYQNSLSVLLETYFEIITALLAIT